VSDLLHALPNSLTTVVGLCFSVGPAAVLRRVWSVIIDALDGCASVWFWSHIGQEVLERIEPSVAERNASGSIAAVIWMSRVVATTLSVLPRQVFRRSGHAMCPVDVTNQAHTTATQTHANGKAPRVDVFDSAAFTAAFAVKVITWGETNRISNYSPSSKDVTGSWAHALKYSMITGDCFV